MIGPFFLAAFPTGRSPKGLCRMKCVCLKPEGSAYRRLGDEVGVDLAGWR